MTAVRASNGQHMRALEYANQIRLARAELKRAIAAGHTSVADAVVSPREETEGMQIAELLASQKRWGDTRCRKFMQSIGLPEDKTVKSLTSRQRHALAAVLGTSRPGVTLTQAVTFRAAA